MEQWNSGAGGGRHKSEHKTTGKKRARRPTSMTNESQSVSENESNRPKLLMEEECGPQGDSAMLPALKQSLEKPRINGNLRVTYTLRVERQQLFSFQNNLKRPELNKKRNQPHWGRPQCRPQTNGAPSLAADRHVVLIANSKYQTARRVDEDLQWEDLRMFGTRNRLQDEDGDGGGGERRISPPETFIRISIERERDRKCPSYRYFNCTNSRIWDSLIRRFEFSQYASCTLITDMIHRGIHHDGVQWSEWGHVHIY